MINRLLLPMAAILMQLVFAQTNNYNFVSPAPGSEHNSSASFIIIRHGELLEESHIYHSITVTGSLSGYHTGTVKLALDGKTINFISDKPYTVSETVTVNVSGLYSVSGRKLPDLEYQFKIANESQFLRQQSRLNAEALPESIQADTGLPSGFPDLEMITENNPSDGCFFIGSLFDPAYSFMMIIDNQLKPVFYRKGIYYDLKVLNNGQLSYYDKRKYKFYLMDSLYKIVDSVYAQGYPGTNDHELRRLDNGNWLLYADQNFTYDMSAIVEGGDSAAQIHDNIIQELDSNKNVIFEWSYFDHIPVTDMADTYDLTQHALDVYHANALDIDIDGNLLSSARNINEVTKIDRNTGDIIWRLGGKSNQFTFLSDPMAPFNHQHYIRSQPDGAYSLFDNGRDDGLSRALRFQIDTANMVCTIINSEDRDVFGNALGSYVIKNNGRQIVSWGYFASISVSELNSAGEPELEFVISVNGSPVSTYRAYKFNWKNSHFPADKDSIDFGFVAPGGMSVKTVNIKNETSDTVIINQIYCNNSAFISTTQLPADLPPGGSSDFNILFQPSDSTQYSGVVYFRSFSETEGAATPVVVTGYAGTSDIKRKKEASIPEEFSLSRNYPNPFNPVTTITFALPAESNIKLTVYNIAGEVIDVPVDDTYTNGIYTINYDGGKLSSGVYIYRLEAVEVHTGRVFNDTKKMILLK